MRKEKERIFLLTLIAILLVAIVYKELQYRRFSRHELGIAVLSSQEITFKVNSFYGTNKHDLYNEEPIMFSSEEKLQYCNLVYQTSPGEQEIYLDDSFTWAKGNMNRLAPDNIFINWTSLNENIEWVNRISLPEGYAKKMDSKKKLYLIAEMHPEGWVTIYAGDTLNKIELGKWKGERTDYNYKIVDDSDLPRETQIGLLINRYRWIGESTDNRRDTTNNIIVEVDQYYNPYKGVVKSDIGISLPVSFKIGGRTEDSTPEKPMYSLLCTINPDPEAMFKKAESLRLAGKPVFFKIEISDTLKFRVFIAGDSIGSDRVEIPLN